MNLQGKTVVVTGGTGALGRSVVSRLVKEGAVCHIPCFDVAELKGFLHAEHEQVQVVKDIDMSDGADVASFYDGIDNLWGVANLAGGFLYAPVGDTSPADFERQWRMNVQTCFLSCQSALAVMRSQTGGGRIVNVSARPGMEPRTGANMVAYTAAKAAVAAMTQAMAEELAGEGIWINAVAPSILDTPDNRADMPDAPHDSWPGLDEVAETILFLLSPMNKVTRGGVVPVFGRV